MTYSAQWNTAVCIGEYRYCRCLTRIIPVLRGKPSDADIGAAEVFDRPLRLDERVAAEINVFTKRQWQTSPELLLPTTCQVKPRTSKAQNWRPRIFRTAVGSSRSSQSNVATCFAKESQSKHRKLQKQKCSDSFEATSFLDDTVKNNSYHYCKLLVLKAYNPPASKKQSQG